MSIAFSTPSCPRSPVFQEFFGLPLTNTNVTPVARSKKFSSANPAGTLDLAPIAEGNEKHAALLRTCPRHRRWARRFLADDRAAPDCRNSSAQAPRFCCGGGWPNLKADGGGCGGMRKLFETLSTPAPLFLGSLPGGFQSGFQRFVESACKSTVERFGEDLCPGRTISAADNRVAAAIGFAVFSFSWPLDPHDANAKTVSCFESNTPETRLTAGQRDDRQVQDRENWELAAIFDEIPPPRVEVWPSPKRNPAAPDGPASACASGSTRIDPNCRVRTGVDVSREASRLSNDRESFPGH